MENNEKKVSVIIVYTDQKKLSEAVHWLELQSVASEIQIISLDNRNNRFSSAAKALNYGASCAEGSVLVFMHQDIYLWDLQAIEKIYVHLTTHLDQIIGVAGCDTRGKVFTDIYETKEMERHGIPTHGNIMNVVTLDECLFAMTRERWSMLRFDEVCCDNWHGYAVDICCANTLQGGSNVLLPLEICHESKGNPRTASFRKTIKNLINKYKGTNIKRIQGTCINVHCSMFGYGWYRVKEFLKDTLDNIGLLKYWYIIKRKICC